MAHVEEFLKALSEREEIRTFIGEHPLEDEEHRMAALASVAQHFGYDVTEEDLTEAIEARMTSIATSKGEAEEAVAELSSEDLNTVVAGKGDLNCKDTYESYDNCWSTDSCAAIVDCYSGIMRW